jgi:hypothetical protein
MIPQKLIDDFMNKMRTAGGPNVESIILFGSAASGEFQEGLSNLNMFCVLRDSSFKALQGLTPAAKWWDSHKQPPPLCMTRQELERSLDVFAIELLDMQMHHRLLFGPNVLEGLQIPMHLHRVQVEYELREKLVLLRQHLLIAGEDNVRLWDILQRSAPSLGTLFRHALIVLGEKNISGRRDAVTAVGQRVGFDSSAMLQVLDARGGNAEAKKGDIRDLVERYVAGLEKVVDAVDMA